MSRARRVNETFSQYRKNIKAEAMAVRRHLSGTYLIGKYADNNVYDAIQMEKAEQEQIRLAMLRAKAA